MIFASDIQKRLNIESVGQFKFLQYLAQFLAIRRLTVPASHVFHKRNALAFDRVANKGHRLSGVVTIAGKIELLDDIFHIVTVNFQNVPTERLILINDRVDVHDIFHFAVNLQAVLVENHDEVVELVLPRTHRGFPHRTFLVLTVGADGEDAVIFLVQLGRQSHADRNREALSQRAG